MKSNLTQHQCIGKCTEYKEEQCNTCLVQQIEKREFDLGLALDDAYVKCDFIKGDVVVYKNHISFDSLQAINNYQTNEYYWLENGQLVHRDDIRSATPGELKAKHRLDQPTALFVSGSS